MSLLKIIQKRDVFTIIILFVTGIMMCIPRVSLALIEPTVVIQLEGVDEPLESSLEARLESDLADLPHPLTPETITEFFHESAKVLNKTLQSYGYYRTHIKKELVHLNNYWETNYKINLGPQLHITHLSFEMVGPGANEPYFLALKNNLPIHAGDAFSVEDYNKTKQLIFTTAEQEGYLRAELMTHLIKINLTDYTVDIILKLNTGPRYFFGPVHFSQTPLDPAFLQRFVPFKKGEPYSSTKVLKFQEGLAASNYFTDVNVEPQLSIAKAGVVPLNAEVSMRKKYQYTFGAGYGTDTGFRGLAGWDWRYVTNTGHQLSTLLQLSSVQQLVNGTYSIPGANPLTDQYNISASIFNNTLPHARSETYQLSGNYVKTLDKWQRILSLTYQFGSYRLGNSPYRETHILTPGITWTYTDIDNLIFATKAQKFSFRIQGAAQSILSDNNLIQAELVEKYIHTFTAGQRLLLRADLGYSVVNNFKELPLTMQFVAGGTQSVRGYDYQSLGPGRYLTVGSIELQQPLFKKLYAVAFYDIGNAYNQAGDGLMQGAGVGLMWASPIGPLELTVGRALNAPGRPTLIQFSMGPDL